MNALYSFISLTGDRVCAVYFGGMYVRACVFICTLIYHEYTFMALCQQEHVGMHTCIA